jgi:hypothetical protein
MPIENHIINLFLLSEDRNFVFQARLKHKKSPTILTYCRTFLLFFAVLALFLCDPPGSLTHAVHCPKYQYFNYRYPFEGVRFGH